jgi:hypothetical protein
VTYPEEFENKSDDERAMIRIGAHIVETWTSLTAVKSKDGTLDDFLTGWSSGKFCVQVDREGLRVVEFLDGGDEPPDDVSGAE